MKTSIKSFIDVLFILLLGTIVLLTQSVQLGALEAEPLRLGGGAVSAVSADDVAVVIVDHHDLGHEGREFGRAAELADALPRDGTVLLVVADDDVRHHRVMQVWSDLSGRGLQVGLGAEPAPAAPSTPSAPAADPLPR